MFSSTIALRIILSKSILTRINIPYTPISHVLLNIRRVMAENGVYIPGVEWGFSPRHCVQTDSGALSDLY
jgi:hypothetical protein